MPNPFVFARSGPDLGHLRAEVAELRVTAASDVLKFNHVGARGSAGALSATDTLQRLELGSPQPDVHGEAILDEPKAGGDAHRWRVRSKRPVLRDESRGESMLGSKCNRGAPKATAAQLRVSHDRDVSDGSIPRLVACES
jgi:hypothetical protein